MVEIRKIAEQLAQVMFGRPMNDLTDEQFVEMREKIGKFIRKEEGNRRRRARLREYNEKKYPQSLCQTCREFDCEWIREKRPVPGWTAMATVIPTNTVGGRESFCVTACPRFKNSP